MWAEFATCAVILISWKTLDGISRRSPDMRGKSLLVLLIKLVILFYMFQIILNVIDANLFYMYNNKEINGFKSPNLEIEGVLKQAKHDFEACKTMQKNWRYENPKVSTFCDSYGEKSLENIFRRSNYFPESDDIYDVKVCKTSYKNCALKNHPDKGGNNDKMMLCTLLKKQCEYFLSSY